MNDRHEHDWWATPGSGLTCACGASKRPLPAPADEDTNNSKEA